MQSRAPSVVLRRALDQRALEQAVAAHERFLRGGPGGQRAFFQYADTPGVDCRRRVLDDADFTGANLEGAILAGSHFERASLYCANLEGCDLRAANLRRADLRGARLAGAVLSGAVMDEADMRAAYIAYPSGDDGLHVLRRGSHPLRAGGFGADFTNCQMRGVRLCAANLKGADFTGAVLEQADLGGAKLTDAIFNDTVLDGVDLQRVIMTPEQRAGCVFAPGFEATLRANEIRERLRAAEEWAATDGRFGAPARIDDEDLRPLAGAFRGRTLTALSACRVRAVQLDFSGASLQGAMFEDADLRGANFDGCDLRGASFQGAKLAHARFAGADLRPLVLSGGRPHPASFAAASLERCDFAGALRG